MMRRVLFTGMLFVLLGAVLAPSAHAIQISRNNPYRSFSISGFNYGAVQWELAQRRKGYSPATWGTRSGNRNLYYSRTPRRLR